MRKHKLFNPGLYIDALRQLRLPALIFGITALVISLLPPLFDLFDGGTSLYSADLFAVTPALYVYMFVGGIGLVMYAFNYQNKRNSSDFYHAMPNTAVCTSVTFSLAIFTCLAATVIATVGITSVFWAISGTPVAGVDILRLMVYFLTGSLLCATAAMVARSLTGTALTHLIVSVIILLFPRFLLSMAGYAVIEKAIIVPQSELGLFLNSGYNIPASLNPLLLMFGSSTVEYGDITFAPAYLYTFVLSAVYFAAFIVLSRVRRSECAGFAALSRPIQHIFRCICILPILFAIPLLAISENQGVWEYVGSEFATVFVIAVIAAIVYCLYEIITTRSFKSLLRSLPLLAILLVAAPPIFSGATTLQANALVSEMPKRESITSVRFASLTDPIYSSDYLYNGYASAVYDGSVSFSDPEIIDICFSALDSTVETFDTCRNSYYFRREKITFVCGSKSITRYVYFTQSELLRISDIAMSDRDYVNKLLALPHSTRIRSLSDEYFNLSETELDEIYSLYYDEFGLDALDPKLPRITTLYGSTKYEGRSIRFAVNLNSAVPKALGRYIEAVNSKSPLDITQIITEAQQLSNGDGYVSVEIYSESYGYTYYLYGDTDHIKEDSDVIKLLESVYIDGEVDPSLPLARINYDLISGSGCLIMNIH